MFDPLNFDGISRESTTQDDKINVILVTIDLIHRMIKYYGGEREKFSKS